MKKLDDAYEEIGAVYDSLQSFSRETIFHDKELSTEALQLLTEIISTLQGGSYYDPKDPRDLALHDLVLQADRFIEKAASAGW